MTDSHTILRAEIVTLENQILDLEFELAQKESALANARSWPDDFAAHGAINNNVSVKNAKLANSISLTESLAPEHETTEPALDSQKALKDLSTTSDRDPRSFSEKVSDLLVTDSAGKNTAIVSHVIVDMADNTENLPDHALQSLYQTQTNSEVKRIAAQVLSMRGDNSLIDKQINTARTGLQSENPIERQKTLAELAKTHYAGAANLIAPMLKDTDTGVKLDALLALRSTGNQSHIHLLDSLTDSPDPAVSWLANDVVKKLQNLSDTARTQLTKEDITAELQMVGIP